MWECRKCHERHEDTFDVCWNCGTSKEGMVDSAFAPAGADERVSEPAARSIDQLVFVGLNGYALALDRDAGEIVWSNSEMRSGYVSLLLDGDRLIVSTNGYMYCLDPLTGRILWHNPLTGYGWGAPASLTSVRGQSSTRLIQQAADEAARSSSD